MEQSFDGFYVESGLVGVFVKSSDVADDPNNAIAFAMAEESNNLRRAWGDVVYVFRASRLILNDGKEHADTSSMQFVSRRMFDAVDRSIDYVRRGIFLTDSSADNLYTNESKIERLEYDLRLSEKIMNDIANENRQLRDELIPLNKKLIELQQAHIARLQDMNVSTLIGVCESRAKEIGESVARFMSFRGPLDWLLWPLISATRYLCRNTK